MQRRDFLRQSSLLLAAAAFTRPRLFAAPPAPPAAAAAGTFIPVRRGVGAYTGRGGAIGWLVNADGTLAIDSQFPDSARDFLQHLPGRADRALDVLINTHHHPDHTAGNPVLGPAAARHVAHATVPALQRARAEKADTLDAQVYAKELFDAEWTLDLGDETVTARHLGPAHTAGDIIVHFQKADVVHLGDLVFNRVYPVLDRPGGTNVGNWIAQLNKLYADHSDDTRFIFGHGHADHGVIGSRTDIRNFRGFLERLRDLVQSEIVAGKPEVQIFARTSMPGYGGYEPNPARFRSALAAVYDELTGG